MMEVVVAVEDNGVAAAVDKASVVLLVLVAAVQVDFAVAVVGAVWLMVSLPRHWSWRGDSRRSSPCDRCSLGGSWQLLQDRRYQTYRSR